MFGFTIVITGDRRRIDDNGHRGLVRHVAIFIQHLVSDGVSTHNTRVWLINQLAIGIERRGAFAAVSEDCRGARVDIIV